MQKTRVLRLMVFGFGLLVALTAQAQSGGGCGASGPEHYLAIQRSNHPERLTFAFGTDLVVSIECVDVLEIPGVMDSVIVEAMNHLEALADTIQSMVSPCLISIAPAQGGMMMIAIATDTIPPIDMVYRIRDQSYVPARFRYTLVYTVNHLHTLVMGMNELKSVDRFISVSVDSLIGLAQLHVAEQEIPRFVARSVTYQVVGGALSTEDAHIHRFGSRSLSLGISPGLSHINNTLTPSFAFPLLFVRTSKKGNSIAYGFAFEMLLQVDPETSYRIRNNWYAEGLFRFGKPAVTLSAGYLIHRDGDLLPPDAVRMGLGVPLNRSGSLQWFTAYHISTTSSGQNLIETGIRLWR